ncbi:MAG TPA: TorF family putative porin [Gallionellaceae bacterium]
MHKSKLLVAVLGALSALPVYAADAPAAPYTITGNVGFVSDYVFNGISQNYREPALQGGFDFAHSNGLYLGTWASNISGNQYTNASMEWDIYGGYNGKVNDDLSYSVGLMQVMYPGGKAYTSTVDTYKKWDTTEAVIGATWKGLNVKYTYTLTNWYGIDTAGFEPTMWEDGSSTANAANVDSKGSGYIELNYSYDLGDKLTVSAHAGHQKINNFDKLSYSDIKLGVTKEVAGGFVLGAAYTKTNATDNTLYHVIANGEDKVLSGSIFAVSVTHSY